MFQCIEEYPDLTAKKNQIMEVTSQPAAFEPQDFQTSLCACCDDMSICCCGLFCLPCLGCSIASDMKECCLCGLGMPIRSVYRTKYNIQGSMCKDWLVSYCCFTCAACQLKRDLIIRIHNGTLKP